MAWFDFSRSSKIGCKWPFFFQEWRFFFQEVNIKEVVVFLRYFLGFLGEERERDKIQSISSASSCSRSSKSFLIGQFEIPAIHFIITNLWNVLQTQRKQK